MFDPFPLLISTLFCARAFFFLFQLPANPSRHGLVCVYVWGCVHVSVGVHSRRVSRDPWWWIRAGTNLLVHLWNENQGRRGQAEEGPITLASGSYTDRSWHFMVWQHTHTHRDTYTRSTPPAFSLSFCFFLDTSAQNRPDSHTNPRVACLAGHVWPRRLNGRPWMRWTHIYKRKLQLGQYHRGETFNTETLQYRRSITYRDVTDVLLSFLCVVCRESGTPRIVLNLCVRCLVLHCGTTGVQYINAHFFSFSDKNTALLQNHQLKKMSFNRSLRGHAWEDSLLFSVSSRCKLVSFMSFLLFLILTVGWTTHCILRWHLKPFSHFSDVLLLNQWFPKVPHAGCKV